MRLVYFLFGLLFGCGIGYSIGYFFGNIKTLTTLIKCKDKDFNEFLNLLIEARLKSKVEK